MSTRKRTEKKPRISAEERKAAIVAAAMTLFARRGFHGATTKDLARAAGVSEALIYSHFPSKEDLYQNVQFLCLEVETQANALLAPRKPGTEALVIAVHTLVFEVLESFAGKNRSELMRRLQAFSMLEDGRFAASFFEKHLVPWFPFVLKCIEASRKAGDLSGSGIPDENLIWFVHHLPMMVRLSTLPEKKISYANSAHLVDQICLFCLRGMGMKESAIKRWHRADRFKKKRFPTSRGNASPQKAKAGAFPRDAKAFP